MGTVASLVRRIFLGGRGSQENQSSVWILGVSARQTLVPRSTLPFSECAVPI